MLAHQLGGGVLTGGDGALVGGPEARQLLVEHRLDELLRPRLALRALRDHLRDGPLELLLRLVLGQGGRDGDEQVGRHGGRGLADAVLGHEVADEFVTVGAGEAGELVLAEHGFSPRLGVLGVVVAQSGQAAFGEACGM
ncbi:hypothetical protein [Streptomyces brasiliscabiei]|uniref:hypothetical protein n=1 Tax=Streptomyces brasiliscabiei TaxID=2736302 RepID=UPI0038F6A598